MLTASWRDGRNLGTSPRLQGQAGFMDCLQGTRLRAGAGIRNPSQQRPFDERSFRELGLGIDWS